jgi:preprotein translocase SecE subunit
MSAEDTLNDKSKRRRGVRQQEPAVENTDMDDEVMDDEGEDDDSSSSRGISERKGRATPSRRALEVVEETQEGNILTRFVARMRGYIEGVRSETQKVIWPSREEVRRLTVIVLIVMIVGSLALGLLSLLFNVLIAAGLTSPIVFIIMVVVAVIFFGVYLRASNQRTSAF